MLEHIAGVIPDNLLSKLLTSWLQPAGLTPTAGRAASPSPAAPAQAEGQAAARDASCGIPTAQRSVLNPPMLECCGNPDACSYGASSNAVQPGLQAGTAPAAAASGQQGPTVVSSSPLAPTPGAQASSEGISRTSHATTAGSSGLDNTTLSTALVGPGKAPLREIIHFHRSICSALQDFAREARALQSGCGLSPSSSGHPAAALASLVERHRFLRSVYVFHSLSEEQVSLMPSIS